MVYNVTYQPGDLPGIFQDAVGTFLQQFIVYAGVIVLVVVIILLIRAARGK